MWHATLVVLGQTCIYVCCEANVTLAWAGYAADDIGVEHLMEMDKKKKPSMHESKEGDYRRRQRMPSSAKATEGSFRRRRKLVEQKRANPFPFSAPQNHSPTYDPYHI